MDTASPACGLMPAPGSIAPHPASASSSIDHLLPDGETDWQLFRQLVSVCDATTTDRERLAHDMKLYRWWCIWNQLCFRSRLKPTFLSVECAEYGSWLGLCSGWPTRSIAIALATYSDCKPLESEGGGAHHGRSVSRLQLFEDLQPLEWNTSLVLLHEMMHDCLFTAGYLGHSHESDEWARLCNVIGRDVLGIPRNYTVMTKRKITVRDDSGNTVYIPHSQGKVGPDGEVVMKPKRKTVWVPAQDAAADSNGFEMASVEEMRHFPYCTGDPFIALHTTTLTEGPLVEKNQGQPVHQPPQF